MSATHIYTHQANGIQRARITGKLPDSVKQEYNMQVYHTRLLGMFVAV